MNRSRHSSLPRRAIWVALAAIVSATMAIGTVNAQNDKTVEGEAGAADKTDVVGEAKESILGGPVSPDPPPDFTEELFWAYGLTCAALAAFTLWCIVQAKRLDKRTSYLEERFQRAHPNQ